ncbi:MAG: transmembrane 220 family protein [Cyclobacteriaceae bacterium]
MKIINFIIAVLFALFAAFQFNDPDGFTWMIIYAYVAIMAGMAAFGRYNLALLIPGIAIFSLYFIFLLPSIFELISSGEDLMNRMAPEKEYIEQSREAGGLLIGLITLIYLVSARHKYSKTT